MSGTWTVTGRLAAARREHTATLLPNGKVLVAGGWNGNVLSWAELYDPTTGLWTSTGPMATARYSHSATLLPGGQVLVAAGWNGGGNVSSAELYDSATGALELTSATSRETHGAAGTFDVNLPLSGDPGIEGRYGPSRQDIVFTFNSNVTGADGVAISCGAAAQPSVDPNDPHRLLVKLNALSCDEHLVSVTLNGVHDNQGNTLASASVTFGLLFGDVNGDGSVNNADIASIRAFQGQRINTSNFPNDLTLDGRIDNKDVGTHKTFRGDSL